ncbi:alpha/beta hydrolase [Marinobacterium arenosum]|uniref:alpha/beta hydrolase n=1 Tax=Marinobacterium arenosum TaxID=2862496 RepID=UPI001C97B5E3|nr:alpha/beta hydrolase [Marinobacterium arenosum]MBY4675369.1 alpha/beta hydrolase [Marinobacterium arenosum]
MTRRFPLSPAMQAFVEQTESFYPAELIDRGIAAQRDAYDAMADYFSLPRPPTVEVWDQPLNGVPVRRYRPQGDSAATQILFAHGGGWYLGGLDSHDSFCAQLAQDCRREVIAVDYRLAPEAPFPAALDDLSAVYRALLAEQAAAPLLLGDSAGGNLVAALTLRCRRLGLPQAVGQVLVYPALAVPGSLPSHQEMADAPLLDRAAIEFCWQCYGPQRGAVVGEQAPLSADSFDGLPPAAIFAAQFDPLSDDARCYGDVLNAAGVDAEYRQIAGLVHGALRAVNRASEADQLYRLICAAVERLGVATESADVACGEGESPSLSGNKGEYCYSPD